MVDAILTWKASLVARPLAAKDNLTNPSLVCGICMHIAPSIDASDPARLPTQFSLHGLGGSGFGDGILGRGMPGGVGGTPGAIAMSGGRKRNREHDWIALLREYELDDRVEDLESEGVASSRDLLDMSESDAKEVRKDLKLRFRFLGLWKDVHTTELQRVGRVRAEREKAEH